MRTRIICAVSNKFWRMNFFYRGIETPAGLSRRMCLKSFSGMEEHISYLSGELSFEIYGLSQNRGLSETLSISFENPLQLL